MTIKQSSGLLGSIMLSLCVLVPQTTLADLGDADSDLVFEPVQPCRLFDTREAGGKIGAGQSRNFFIHGNVAGQGGDLPAGGGDRRCPAPRGEPIAVSLNVTVVAPEGGGFVTVYPKGTPRPFVSNLNFVSGQTVPNTVIVKTRFDVADTDITVFALQRTHVIADVNGYFYGARIGSKVGAVAYSESDSLILLTKPFFDFASDVEIISKELNAPASGHAVVNASASMSTRPGVQNSCHIVSSAQPAFDPVRFYATGAPGLGLEGKTRTSIFATKGFEVSKGFNRFTLICARENGTVVSSDDTRVFNSSINAVYSPNLL